MLRKNDNKALPFGKLLWYDPNPTDDVPINLSELTISVDLEVTSKSRSIIITNSAAGTTSVTNTGESTIMNVNFFNGSKNESKGSSRALTTNYTNLQDLTTDIDNDFEALGIDSIDITFNSSYAPTVKIKFIDIRGAAIFSRGGSGRYKFFFELPYPIFRLTVKGYYGRPVQYCLHLLRFNASFNSQTGNFEIDCDFIGFTYALLTDMLMGLVRASVTTKRGQKIFSQIKSEYKNQASIITLDELVVRISEIDETVKKLKKGEEVVRVAANQQARVEVENLKQMVQLHLDSYANGATKFTNTYSNGVLIIAEPGATKQAELTTLKTQYITDVIKQISKKIKKNGSDGVVNFSSGDINDTRIQKELDVKNDDTCYYFTDDFGYVLNHGFKTSDAKDLNKIKELYKEGTGSEKRITYMTALLKDINFGTTQKITIIDLSRAIIACDNSLLYLDNQNEAAITSATDKLKVDIRAVLGFDPTIRNLFRILCTSTEVFLQCMLDVSKDAEKDGGGRRAAALAKLGPNLNNNPNSSKIFPWPEYRKKGLQNDGYYEEWMGNEIPTTDVPELLFTEELLQEMILQARKDKAREADLNGSEGWYPISVVDTPANNGLKARMLNNPYKIGLMDELPGVTTPQGTSDEALRVLMYRVFLLLGIANRNNITATLIKTHAKLEAENLYDVLKKMPIPTIASGIKRSIIDTPVTKIIQKFLDGGPINLSLKKNSPFFVEDGTDYRYVYITKSTGRAYIPINGNFNGDIFYDEITTELKWFDKILEIRDVKGGLFVGNVTNHTRISDDDGGYNKKVDNDDGLQNIQTRRNYIENDGAIHVKIISEGSYINSSLTPSFGSSALEDYVETGEINHARISEKIDDKTKANFYFNPLRSGPYGANQYSRINYESGAEYSNYSSDNVTGTLSVPEGGEASSVIAFFNEGQPQMMTNFVKQAPLSGQYNIQELTFNGFASKHNEAARQYGWHSAGVDSEGYFMADNDVTKKPLLHYDDYGKNRQVLNKRLANTGELYVPKIEYCVDSKISYSLFGSEFYYFQNDTEPAVPDSTLTAGNASKALLFLHCFPFQGVNRNSDDTWDKFMFDYNSDDIEESAYDINTVAPASEILGIKALFRLHNAFIEAPKIWTLFIGAMLWRIRFFNEHSGADPVRWEYPVINKPLIPDLGKKPRIDEFFSVSLSSKYRVSGMHFYSKEGYPSTYGTISPNGTGTYSRIDETIMGLPSQVKHEFINEFLAWAKSSDGFVKIQKALEIKFNYVPAEINTSGFLSLNNKTGYSDKWDFLNATYKSYPGKPGVYALKTDDIIKYLGQNVFDNYIMVAPISSKKLTTGTVFRYIDGNPLSEDDIVSYIERIKDDTQWHNYNMELKADGGGMKLVVNLLKEKVFIQNLNPHVWNPPNLKNQPTGKKVKQFMPITVSKASLELFITTFHEHFSEISKSLEKEAAKEEDRIQQELFKSMDDDKIKLNIYRTLTAIYSKWIGGLRGDMFSQCTVNDKDMGIANHERNNPKSTRLIDSFRFLDRSFNDIGDAFYMNPQVFYNMIVNNRNASFFDIANKVLSDNNFNFIPLPTFVNFNKPEDLAEIFQPSPYNNDPVTGPSFVCVYAGQSSTNIDLGENANYPDDGIFIIVKDGNIIPDTAPDDLMGKKGVNADGGETLSSTLSVYETNLPVFTVNYGQQNQNYFKDIKLDQREFSETAESLEIIDNISQGGDKRKNVMVGQNLFNTYQTRSYSCEIEMLGCALIQPMMYFQLNNIPMFRGLYLIINVSHSIKPNGMSTTFKGVRVKKVKTPLLTASDVLMTLIGDVSNVNTSGGSTSGRIPTITTNADKNQVAKVVAARFKYYGWCDNCIASFLGDMGRENSWNRDVIFNEHIDPKNGQINRGIVSFQGARGPACVDYMESKGHMPLGKTGPMNRDDSALESMVDFLLFYDPGGVKAHGTYFYPTPPSSSGTNRLKNHAGNDWTAADFKNNDNSTLKCSQALWGIIKYAFETFNTEDSKFFAAKNHPFAKKAKELGIVNYTE